MTDPFTDPLFQGFVLTLGNETLPKRQLVNQLSERYATFGPLMEKIRNSLTPQLLNTLEDSVKVLAENPVQNAANGVLEVLHNAKATLVKLKNRETELQADVDSFTEYGVSFATRKMDELMKVRCSHRIREGGTCQSCYDAKVKTAARFGAEMGAEWTRRYGRIALSESTKKLMG